MADNITLDVGAGGAVVSTEEVTTLNGGAVSAQHIARSLLAFRTGDGTAVDAPRGGGVEADALRVTVASDSTGVLSVDDNGGSLTVDGSVTADTELTTADLDTGAGTDTRAVVGLVGAASGGGALIEGTAANGLEVDVTRVSGTVTVGDGGGALTVDNAGTFATQVDGAALTALQLLDDVIFADDAAFTPGTSKVSAIGMLADQTSADSVNEGDIGIPRMTLDRLQLVTLAPSADSPGVDTFRSADIDETEEDVKTTAGKLYGYAVYNDHTAEIFLQFWDATAANVTPGTTTPELTFPIAGGASAHIMFENGIAFATAITVGATGGFGDGTAPGGTVSGTIFYK